MVECLNKTHENLNQELEERIQKWETFPCIYDIFDKYLAELKLYEDYIKIFEDSFRSLIDSIEESKEFEKYLNTKNYAVSGVLNKFE